MLSLRKITYIDRAEPEALWTYNLKKQWSYGDLIAVRVHDANERVLGSTIPVPFAAPKTDESQWGVSWIEEDVVEAEEQPVREEGGGGNDDAGFSAAAQEPIHPDAAPESPSAPSYPANAAEGRVPPPSSPADAHESSEAPQPSAPAPAESADALAANAAADANAASKEGGADTNEASVDGAEGAAAAAVAETAQSPPKSPAQPASPATADDAAPAAGTQPASGAPSIASPVSPSAPPPPPPAAATAPVAERRPSFSSCFPINISQAAKGPLSFEVITASGTKLAVAEVDVQDILRRDADGAPQVQHYAAVLTPMCMKQKEKANDTVYAVLEISVVIGSADADTVVAMSASASYAAIPTSLDAGPTCGFSTRTFYYPPTFLTGTGEYIVTNVLCVESHSDDPVRLEVALPEDLKKVGVLPDKKIIINERGGRALFTFTWNVFDAYVALDAAKDSYSDHSSVGLHILIRDGTENKAPIDITLVGDIPSSAAESTGPFMFYVNHARVSNIACSAADDARLDDILPISLVTRAGV